MTELINNTLQIIAKISFSRYAYILKVNNTSHKVLTITGGRAEIFDEFNNEVLKKYKKDTVSQQSLEKSKAYKNIKQQENISSLLIQELVSYREKNESIFIILFSETANQFTKDCKERVISVLSILSSQIKNWMDEQPYNADANTIDNDYSVNHAKLLNGLDDYVNTLLQVSGDFIFIIDNAGKILLVNQPGADLLDYTIEELKGKHFTDLIDEEDYLNVSGFIKDALSKNKVTNFDANLVSKYEKIIPFNLNCQTIMKDLKVIGMIGIGKDISREKQLREELNKIKPKLTEANRLVKLERARTQHQLFLIEELNRLKSDFVSNISHEFRTPLASIIGFSETIESDPDLPPEMKKEFNNVILNESKRLAKLINDVIDFSDIKEGKISLIKVEFDGLKVLKTVVDEAKKRTAAKNIDLTFEYPNEEIIVNADKERIEQVFEALIDNSIKFTNEFGRIKIIANNLFREFEVIISDTGVGIAEKDLPYIFQQFYRGSRSGFETHGTGVGLVFVKQIVDLHKGLIMVQSELGSGSTFMLKLPKSSNIEKN